MNEQIPGNAQNPSYEQGPERPSGWSAIDGKTRIGAAIAGIALCGFGFLGGMAVGGASADDVQNGPGGRPGMGGGPSMGGGPPGMSQDGTGQQGVTPPDGSGTGSSGSSGTDSGI
ncbi:hypothetical protein [Mumia sp. Pv 4-285]|uniref:hypothetical protein n=1 Tax=Mumia qirimensis TaxID=3234852 RepID=UPI00351D92EB